MNQDSVGWNDSLLSQLFNKEDIQAIKKTPISIMDLSDRMVWWSLTKDGQYSVNSGHKLAKE